MDAGDPYTATKSATAPIIVPERVAEPTAKGDKPLGFNDGNYRSQTKLGNYRPFRHRSGPNRAVPPQYQGLKLISVIVEIADRKLSQTRNSLPAQPCLP